VGINTEQRMEEKQKHEEYIKKFYSELYRSDENTKDVLQQEKNRRQKQQTLQIELNSIWEPVQVYPPLEAGDQPFDKARQIKAIGNSSFLVTERGVVYSWGGNNMGLLGRKLRLAQRKNADEKVADNSGVPTPVDQLSKVFVSRLKVMNNKVMAFQSESGLDHHFEADSDVNQSEYNDRVTPNTAPGKRGFKFQSLQS